MKTTFAWFQLLALIAFFQFGCTEITIHETAPETIVNDSGHEGPTMIVDFDTQEIGSGSDPDRPKGSLGWQQSGELVTTDHNKSFSMQRNFAPYAGVYTIQFGVIPPTDPLNPSSVVAFEAEADISWAVEGGTIRRRVSIGNGVEISAPAQAVNVVVHDVSDPLVSFAGRPYVVFVTCAPGPRASTSQLPTLVEFSLNQSIGPASGLIVPVPDGAGAISVEVTIFTDVPGVALAPNTVVVQQDAGLGTVKLYDITDKAPLFVPLAPNAISIEVHNFGAVPIRAQVTWGIDG